MQCIYVFREKKTARLLGECFKKLNLENSTLLLYYYCYQCYLIFEFYKLKYRDYIFQTGIIDLNLSSGVILFGNWRSKQGRLLKN